MPQGFKINPSFRRKIKRGLNVAAKVAVDESAKVAVEAMRDAAPVKTGRLRRSIRVLKKGATSARVGTTLFYAGLNGRERDLRRAAIRAVRNARVSIEKKARAAVRRRVR